jgi:hypothetical protein
MIRITVQRQGVLLRNIFHAELYNANNALDCIHDEPAP